jgi:hypothetical protein
MELHLAFTNWGLETSSTIGDLNLSYPALVTIGLIIIGLRVRKHLKG